MSLPKWQEELKRQIHDSARLIAAAKKGASHLSQAHERHIYPQNNDLSLLGSFDEAMPEGIGNYDQIIDLLHSHGSPNTVAMTGGRYFGFVNGSILPVGLASRWIADAWDQNTAMNVLSPICSKLEEVTERWLINLFGLPESTVAGYVSGTSMATYCGLAAGRMHIFKNLGWDWHQKGMYGAPKIRIVTSKQAHSTAVKALGLLGFGKDHVEWIDVDDQGRIDVSKMPPLDNSTIVVLQAGNVNSGSFDDFDTICDRANEVGAWVHIDGAFGLWAECVKSRKYLTKGLEKADSWSVDGHKTLNTPYDNGIVLCKYPEAITSALHMSGSYIVNSEQRDGMYFTPEMSRRARIVELWATMKYLGKEGIDAMIQNMCDRAIQFAEEFRKANFEILNDVEFNQVMVACDTDELTMKMLEKVQEERVCWCGPSLWFGRRVIRISVCSWATTERDVTLTVESFIRSREKAIKELKITEVVLS